MFTFLSAASCAGGAEAPSGLRCEMLAHPEKTVILDPRPEFGWIMNSDLPDEIQTAYRVITASSIKMLNAGRGDMWDSGRVASDRSIDVEYGGRPLRPGARYYWKVMTWDRRGRQSPWSVAQEFAMYSRPGSYRPGPGMYSTPPDMLERTRFTIRTKREADKELWKCATPRYPLTTTEVAPAMLVKNADGHYFVDFGKDGFSYLRLTVDSPVDGHVVKIILGEHADGHKVARARGCVVYISSSITLKKGTHTYTPKMGGRLRMPAGVDVKPFRYVEIINSPVEIDESMLVQVVYHYEFDDNASSFKSSDKTLNDVWEFCKYSIKATSFCGAYVDGDRQRDTLHGDGFVNQLCHYGVDHEYTMPRHSHELLTMSQHWASEWMMCAPLMAWHDYMYTGNTESMAKYYEVLKLKTLHGLARDDGLIGPRLHPCFGEWATGKHVKRIFAMRDKADRVAALEEILRAEEAANRGRRKGREIVRNWALRQLASEKGEYSPGKLANPEEILAWSGNRTLLDIIDYPYKDKYDIVDVCTVPNAMHYGTLVAMRDIALALKKTKDADFFTTRAALVRKSINQKLFDREKGVYVDGEGSRHVSIHANMFPLAFGIVPDEHMETVTAYVKSRGMACTVYGAQYLMEGLYNAGEDEHAFNLMSSRELCSWAHMIYDVGSTISMEAWDVRFKGNTDWNHPWGAVPANIIPRFLMGVRPLEPGFRKALIQPSPGDLASASGTVPTIRGPVVLAFENVPGESFSLEVDIPANMTARVGVPCLGRASTSLVLDGKRVEGVLEGKHVFLDPVGSGRHTIKR